MLSSKTALFPRQSEILYSFSGYALRPDGTLLRGPEVIAIPPKELAILRVLLANAGRIVSPQQLLEAGWGKVHVSGDSLPRCVSSLRARLDSQTCIQAVYKQGYRFTLTVEATRLTSAGGPGGLDRNGWASQAGLLPRLAILPFVSQTGVPESFGAGIAEETMLQLGVTSRQKVEVLARDSVFSLAAQGKSAAEVGGKLRADLVLTGTISSLALHYRLRAEMIRVEDEVQLWVEDFLLPRELFAYADARLAKRITARICNTFASPISPRANTGRGGSIASLAASGEGEKAARADNGAKAYSMFLEARHQWDSCERHRMQDALQGFERAAEMDPSLSASRIQLVHGNLHLAQCGYLRADIAAERARLQSTILLGAADSSYSTVEALRPALGWIHLFHDRNVTAAALAFEDSFVLRYHPLNSRYRARFHLARGQFSQAIDVLQAGVSADPFSPAMHSLLAWACYLAGDSGEALRHAEEVLRDFPDHPISLVYCAMVHCGLGSQGDKLLDRALELASKLVQSRPYFDPGYATLADVLARQGRSSDARAILERQQWLSRERFVMRSFHAPALVALGDLDGALKELAVSEQQHCPWIFELLHDPRLRALAGRPEFERLRGISKGMDSGSPVA